MNPFFHSVGDPFMNYNSSNKTYQSFINSIDINLIDLFIFNDDLVYIGCSYASLADPGFKKGGD